MKKSLKGERERERGKKKLDSDMLQQQLNPKTTIPFN